MSDEKGYNGYTNYETWACALWIDNDEGMQDNFNQQAQLRLDENEDKEDAIIKLCDDIKSWIDEYNPLPEAGLYTDLLNAAISEINFYEIAENFINEVYEENKE